MTMTGRKNDNVKCKSGQRTEADTDKDTDTRVRRVDEYSRYKLSCELPSTLPQTIAQRNTIKKSMVTINIQEYICDHNIEQ